jgi:hypothetical protein
VSVFHFIERERAWRRKNGKPEGFEMLNRRKPIGNMTLSIRTTRSFAYVV